jgi:type II secretory pathway pseudopilin PulG
MQQKLKNKNKLISGFTRTPKFGVTTKGGGFTLIETLFGVAIFVLIALALTLFSRNVWVYNSFVSEGLTGTDAARQILKTMVSEIRTASVASNGAYAIDQANVSSFIFYSDIDNDNLREKVRYFLVGTTLQKGVIKPTGSPLTYNSADEKISILASDTTSLAFDYFNKNYDGTSAALTFPINIPDVRLIKITVTLDKDPNRAPLPATFSTQVSIRNLKDNL